MSTQLKGFALWRYNIARPGVLAVRACEKITHRSITPNTVSWSRAYLAVLALLFLLGSQYAVAIWIVLIAYYTDAVDGELARENELLGEGIGVTDSGKILDPFVDKIVLFAVTGPLVVVHVDERLGWWLIINGAILGALVGVGWLIERYTSFEFARGANFFGKAKFVGEFIITMMVLVQLVFLAGLEGTIFWPTVMVGILGTLSYSKHILDNLVKYFTER